MSNVSTHLKSLQIDREPGEDDRRGRRWHLPVLISALLLLIVAGAAIWHPWDAQLSSASRPAPGRPAALPGLTQTAPSGRLIGTGFVVARRRATVAAEVTGRIASVLVEEGQFVRKGQLLAVLDRRVRDKEVNVLRQRTEGTRAGTQAVQVDLEDAENSLKRDAELARNGFLSPLAAERSRAKVASLKAQLARSRADANVADADLERLQTELGQYLIRAPFSGVVLDKNAQAGEIVSPISGGGGFTRTGICTIVDMDSLEVEAEINEANLSRVAIGQKVDAVLDAYPGQHWVAKVITVVPWANRDRASFRVRIALEARDRRIMPGMAVKVTFE
jgi:RND family efflux transporter MFP subunit